MLREAMDELDFAHPREFGPMLTLCPVFGCNTVTMGGGTCVEHDVPAPVEYPRGRPFVGVREEVLAGAAPD